MMPRLALSRDALERLLELHLPPAEPSEGIVIGRYCDGGECRVGVEELALGVAISCHRVRSISLGMLLAERGREAGLDLMIFDRTGAYTRLMYTVPDAKILRLGVDFAVAMLDPMGMDPEAYANWLAGILSSCLSLGETERRLLYEGLQEVVPSKSPCGLRDLMEAIQDLAGRPSLTPQEYAKAEAVRRAIAPMLRGPISAALGSPMPLSVERLARGLTVLDLSRIPLPEYQDLAIAIIMLRVMGAGKLGMAILIDDASPLARARPLLELLDLLMIRGVTPILAVHEELAPALSRRAGLHLVRPPRHPRPLPPKAMLIYGVLRKSPKVIIPDDPEAIGHPLPGDEETAEHMRRLGIELRPLEELALELDTMIERDFRDLAASVYRLLKAIGEQIVPRGEAIRFLMDEGLTADEAAKVLDAIQMLGYTREDYVSGRRALVLTRKAVIALDEYERKLRRKAVSEILRKLREKGPGGEKDAG